MTLAIRILALAVKGWPLDSCHYLESYFLLTSLFLGSTILKSACFIFPYCSRCVPDVLRTWWEKFSIVIGLREALQNGSSLWTLKIQGRAVVSIRQEEVLPRLDFGPRLFFWRKMQREMLKRAFRGSRRASRFQNFLVGGGGGEMPTPHLNRNLPRLVLKSGYSQWKKAILSLLTGLMCDLWHHFRVSFNKLYQNWRGNGCQLSWSEGYLHSRRHI